MPLHTLGKNERLKSRKKIDEVFAKGKSKHFYPIRTVYLRDTEETAFPIQFTVSVPKRMYKTAVDRNLLKRRIREAYRKNNLSQEILEYSTIEKSVSKHLEYLYAQISL